MSGNWLVNITTDNLYVSYSLLASSIVSCNYVCSIVEVARLYVADRSHPSTKFHCNSRAANPSLRLLCCYSSGPVDGSAPARRKVHLWEISDQEDFESRI